MPVVLTESLTGASSRKFNLDAGKKLKIYTDYVDDGDRDEIAELEVTAPSDKTLTIEVTVRVKG